MACFLLSWSGDLPRLPSFQLLFRLGPLEGRRSDLILIPELHLCLLLLNSLVLLLLRFSRFRPPCAVPLCTVLFYTGSSHGLIFSQLRTCLLFVGQTGAIGMLAQLTLQQLYIHIHIFIFPTIHSVRCQALD